MKEKDVTSYIYNFFNQDDSDGETKFIEIDGFKVCLGINVILLPGVKIKANPALAGKITTIGSNSFIGQNAVIEEGSELPPKTILQGDLLQPAGVGPRVMLVGDDFGRNESNNQCTAHLLETNALHHASLVLNKKESTIEAIGLLRQNPNWNNKVSLHFNITEGYSLLSDPNLYYSVNDPVSLGKRINSTTSSFYLSRKDKKRMLEELHAQIHYYKSLGLKPRYFDSHGNINFKWPVAKAITPILKEEGFEYVRIPRDTHAHPIYDFLFKRRVTKLYRKNFKTADAFLYITDLLNSDFFKFNGKTIEIMTHPFMKNGEYINRRDVGFEAIFAFLSSIGAMLL